MTRVVRAKLFAEAGSQLESFRDLAAESLQCVRLGTVLVFFVLAAC